VDVVRDIGFAIKQKLGAFVPKVTTELKKKGK